MITAQAVVAKRYAQAFLAIFGDQMREKDLAGLDALEDFLARNKHVLSFFMISQIDDTVKVKALSTLLQSHNLDTLLAPLSVLLIKNRRVFLLPEIMRQLAILYKDEKKIMSFTVTSSHALEPHDREAIKKFLARQTGCDIIDTIKLDKNLIAGIRLQSSSALWEYSIRKQLKNIQLPLIR